MAAKRKHRSTGVPRGGLKPGGELGRPPGPNALEYGETKALFALRKRIPEDAHPDDIAVADEARDVLLKVMRGFCLPDMAGNQLKAATQVRLEVCGPIAQKVEVTGKDGGPISLSLNLSRESVVASEADNPQLQDSPETPDGVTP